MSDGIVPERWKDRVYYYSPPKWCVQLGKELGAAEAEIADLRTKLADEINARECTVAEMLEWAGKHGEVTAKLEAAERERDGAIADRNRANDWLLDGMGGQAYLDKCLEPILSQRDEAIAVLRLLEWSEVPGNIWHRCPRCQAWKEEGVGHAPDCALHQLLEGK